MVALLFVSKLWLPRYIRKAACDYPSTLERLPVAIPRYIRKAACGYPGTLEMLPVATPVH